MTYRLIAELPDYLVAEKPSGLITHGAPHLEGDSFASLLANAYPELHAVGDEPLHRPGIVHRLDQYASGLLVVARSQAAFEHLKQQFIERQIEKRYTALSHGKIGAESGLIDFPIARRSGSAKMSALPKTNKGEPQSAGRAAVTEFTITHRYINYTLLDVRIHTGRTHQIRCHLAAYGYPIVGDDLYGTQATKRKNAKVALGRLFLHAHTLAFDDMNGVRQTYSCELPDELNVFLKSIR